MLEFDSKTVLAAEMIRRFYGRNVVITRDDQFTSLIYSQIGSWKVEVFYDT